MTNVSEQNKRIAKTVAGIFGGENSVRRYRDETNEYFVDILSSLNSPETGLTSFSTIGLSGYPLIKDGEEYSARVEFVGAAQSNFLGFANALATSAFNIIKSNWFCYPGAIFPDVLSMHEVSSSMTSFLFTPPFLWEDVLKTIHDGDLTVAWLMAIPISLNEEKYAAEHGSDALEDLLEEHSVDIFDLERRSVV
jgi:hypothetical protein